ncbi:MAG: DUF3098 domain-containing protein [Muribaculaceae bacterium]|nr:DUF3098 domain-containing protein [Muribaculaceae bacterium]
MAKVKTTGSTPSNVNRNQIEAESHVQLPLLKHNFIVMAIAGAMIVIGFLLMTGAGSTETEFNPDIFSTRRIVVGPTIAFLGFILMGVGIIWNGRKNNKATNADEAADSNS